MPKTQTKPRRVPTPKQRKGALAVIENAQLDKPKPLGEVLENVGYGSIAENPSRIIEAQGFKQALAELGLTENLITTSLVEDIKAKPKFRIQELKLGAEILGMVKREDSEVKVKTQTTYNFIFSPEVQEQIKATNEIIKAKLINAQTSTETMEA